MNRARVAFAAWLGALVFYVASVLTVESLLPQRVPTYLYFVGQPNSWMPGHIDIAIFLAMGIGISFLQIALIYSIRFLPPAKVNLPNHEYWLEPEHFHEACDFLLYKTFWMSASLLVFLAALDYVIVKANRSVSQLFDQRLTWWLAAAFFALVFYWSVTIIRYFKNTENTVTNNK